MRTITKMRRLALPGLPLAMAALLLQAAAHAAPPLPEELQEGSITSVKWAQESLPYFVGMNRDVEFTSTCAMPPVPRELATYRFSETNPLPTPAEMDDLASRLGMGVGGVVRPGPDGTLKLSKPGYEILFWARGEFRFEDLTARDDGGFALPSEPDAAIFAEAWLAAVGLWRPDYELVRTGYRQSALAGRVRMTLSYLQRLDNGYRSQASGVDVTIVAGSLGPRVRALRHSDPGVTPYKWVGVIPLEAALARVRQGNCLFSVDRSYQLPIDSVIDRCRLEYSHQAGHHVDPIYVLEGTGTEGPFTITVSAVEGKYLVPEIEATADVRPRTLHLGSDGRWVTVRLSVPVSVDGVPVAPRDVDLGTVLLNDRVVPEAEPSRIGPRDLMLKFDRAAVQAALGLDGSDREVTVVVSGSIHDRIFLAKDKIRLVH